MVWCCMPDYSLISFLPWNIPAQNFHEESAVNNQPLPVHQKSNLVSRHLDTSSVLWPKAKKRLGDLARRGRRKHVLSLELSRSSSFVRYNLRSRLSHPSSNLSNPITIGIEDGREVGQERMEHPSCLYSTLPWTEDDSWRKIPRFWSVQTYWLFAGLVRVLEI